MKTTLYALMGATLLAGPALAQDKDLLIGSTFSHRDLDERHKGPFFSWVLGESYWSDSSANNSGCRSR